MFNFLNNLGIDYNTHKLLLGTKVRTKRDKMGWMLREVFDYEVIPQEERGSTLNNLYDFVRNHPNRLMESVPTLGKKRDKLREKAQDYISQAA